MAKDLKIKKEDTLLNYLINADLPYSKGKIRSLLKHFCISINGVTTTQFDAPLKPNDIVTVIEYNPNLDTPLDILFEDKNLLVINKKTDNQKSGTTNLQQNVILIALDVGFWVQR